LLKLNWCCRNVLRLCTTSNHLMLSTTIRNWRRLRRLMLAPYLLIWRYCTLLHLFRRLPLILRNHGNWRLGPLFLHERWILFKHRIRRHVNFDILIIRVPLRLSSSIHLHNVLDQIWIISQLLIVFLMRIHRHLLILMNIFLYLFFRHVFGLPVCLGCHTLLSVPRWILICVTARMNLLVPTGPYYIRVACWERLLF